MKTKYDWSGVPSIYKWIAKDKDDHIFAYIGKPYKGNKEWYGFKPLFIEQDNSLWWQDSLEERPND